MHGSSHEKQASENLSSGTLPWNYQTEYLEKQAEEIPLEEELTEGAMIKIASVVRSRLEKEEEEFHVKVAEVSLLKSRLEAQDPEFLEKLAVAQGNKVEGKWFSDRELEPALSFLEKKANLEAELVKLRHLQKEAQEKLGSLLSATGRLGWNAAKTGTKFFFSDAGMRMLSVKPGASPADNVANIIGAQ